MLIILPQKQWLSKYPKLGLIYGFQMSYPKDEDFSKFQIQILHSKLQTHCAKALAQFDLKYKFCSNYRNFSNLNYLVHVFDETKRQKLKIKKKTLKLGEMMSLLTQASAQRAATAKKAMILAIIFGFLLWSVV